MKIFSLFEKKLQRFSKTIQKETLGCIAPRLSFCELFGFYPFTEFKVLRFLVPLYTMEKVTSQRPRKTRTQNRHCDLLSPFGKKELLFKYDLKRDIVFLVASLPGFTMAYPFVLLLWAVAEIWTITLGCKLPMCRLDYSVWRHKMLDVHLLFVPHESDKTTWKRRARL